MNCVPLDEFNLVCYLAMYGNIQRGFHYIIDNSGNQFEKYFTFTIIHLNTIVILTLLVEINVVLCSIVE